MRQLIERNKKNQGKNIKNGHLIPFPFVGVATNLDDWQ